MAKAKRKKTTVAKSKTTSAPQKKSAPKKTPASKKTKRKAIDLDSPDSIDQLLELGRQQEEQREARAAEQAEVVQSVREPVAVRPSGPLDFGYPWWFDDAIPAERREALVALFGKFTNVSNEQAAFFVAAPDTEPERRRAAWDNSGMIVELEQLEAQLPERDEAARFVRLERALADKRAWTDVVMLLSTWDPSTLANALAVAERGLARWSDELRSLPDAWKDRADLRPLARVGWGTIEEVLARPDLENVRMVKTQDIEGLRAHAERLAHITGLEVSGLAGNSEFITELSAIDNLEHLALQQNTYSSGTGKLSLREILAAPHFQKLRAFSLYGFTLTEDDVEALADCEQPLRFVRLQHGGMKPKFAGALGRLMKRKHIERLDLKYNDLGPKGATTLFGEGDFSALEVLDFSANEIGTRGIAAMCKADVSSLRWFNVSSNAPKEQLDTKAAELLASTPALAKLETLNVYGHPIKGAGVAALVGSSTLHSLRALCTAFPDCAHAEILAAVSGTGGPKLDGLHIGHPATSKKKADWSRGQFLASVRSLNAESIGGNEYEALLACPHFGSLENLALGGCYSDQDKAFAALLRATPPPKLRYLDLNGWKLTPSQATQLAESPLGRQLWGLVTMSIYTPPEVWRAFYDGGLPLATHAVFTCDPASEHQFTTTFREEI